MLRPAALRAVRLGLSPGRVAVLMTLALSGHLAPLYVFIIAAVMGIVRPSDLGVRGALVATIMPHGQLIGAISICLER